jgi:hypothetical protein
MWTTMVVISRSENQVQIGGFSWIFHISSLFTEGFFWVDWDTKSRKSSNRLAIAIFQVGFHAQVWISLQEPKAQNAMLVYRSSTSNIVNQRINNTRFQHLLVPACIS